MGHVRKNKQKLRGRSKSKGRLTIMIFKGLDKPRTFEISSRLISWASLFFIFYIVATIFLTNKYLDIYRVNKMQARKIAELRIELIKTTKSLERAKQHIALLDGYIREEKEQGPEPMSTADYTESSSPKIVDINELKVKRDGSTIEVTFKIVNKQLNEEPIGGYIFVLARPKDLYRSEVWVYPSSPIKEGLPVNYTNGYRFSIQNFMPFSAKLGLGKSLDKQLILEILIYDRDGKLILKKVAKV